MIIIISQNLSLPYSAPRYCIRLVTESQVFCDGKKMSGAVLVAEFLMSAGLHETAHEKFCSICMNARNKIVGRSVGQHVGEEQLSYAMLMLFFWHILIHPMIVNQVMVIKG